jgi:hypothetical protein
MNQPFQRARRARRGRYLLMGILLLCCALIGVPQSVTAISHRHTALYVWDNKPYPQIAQLVQFVRDHDITEIHVAQANGIVTPTTKEWTVQLRAALPQMRLIALAGGDCDWLLPSSKGVAAQWVADKAASGLFDGYDIDVEPWSCPSWKSDQPATITAYLALLRSAHAAAQGRPLYATITYWLDEVPLSPGTLANAVIDATDGVVVMAYHDTYERIVQDAQSELMEARQQHKYLRIAVTTDAVRAADLEAGNTFADNGASSIDAVLDRLNTMPCKDWCANDGFAGPIVQAYATWRRL